MATDMERLIVSLEARTKAFENQLKKANATAQKQLRGVEQQFDRTNKKLSRGLTFGGGAMGRYAGAAGAALAARQIQQYADAWTEAGNKIAAASQISGRQARGLGELNDIADKTRSGLTETVDLYAKLLRSTKDVAKSEAEVALATEIVNKSFKAGGAAASEQAAGILQLSQALGSGILQGDELRSLRENAPLLAQAIADEFKTTIAGLKQLGADGELTTDRVFKAILNAQPKIEKAFGATNATIGDGFKAVNNALTESVGRIDAVTDISGKAGQALRDLVVVIEALTKGVEYLSGTPAANLVSWLDDVVGRLEPLNKSLAMLGAGNLGAGGDMGKDFLSGMDKIAKPIMAIAELNKKFDEFRESLAEMKPDAVRAFDALRGKINEGTIGAEDAREAIKNIVGGDPMLERIKSEFDPLLDVLKKVQEEASKAKLALLEIGGDDRQESLANQRGAKDVAKFRSGLTDEATRKSDEKELQAKTAEVMEKAEKAGLAMTEAAARIEAASLLASESSVKASEASVGSAADLIKKFEGFSSKPYWDVNAYRAGFGSDTVTLSDGSVQKVTQGITVSLETANRDLARRIEEFQRGIEGSIGAETFRGMNEGQQAALTSIAYNYGSLPDRIVDAIKTGNTETVYNAIKDLGGDNGGINRKRRNSEAETFLSGAPEGIQQDITLRQEQANIIRETMEAIRQQNAAIGEETAMLGASNAEKERARLVTETLNDLQRQGIEITDEIRAAVEAEADARYGQVAAYDAAVVAADALKEKQAELAAQQEEINNAFAGAMKSFISDLAHGKSLTEALTNAVGRLADRLLDIALDNIFAGFGKGGGGGGGLLGGIGGFLSSLFGGFESGGYTGNAGRKQAAGVVHGQEFVVNARATRKNRALLEAINAGAPGYAQGGFVGRMAPRSVANDNRQAAAPNVNITVVTPDAPSFMRSQNQIAAKTAASMERTFRTQ